MRSTEFGALVWQSGEGHDDSQVVPTGLSHYNTTKTHTMLNGRRATQSSSYASLVPIFGIGILLLCNMTGLLSSAQTEGNGVTVARSLRRFVAGLSAVHRRSGENDRNAWSDLGALRSLHGKAPRYPLDRLGSDSRLFCLPTG